MTTLLTRFKLFETHQFNIADTDAARRFVAERLARFGGKLEVKIDIASAIMTLSHDRCWGTDHDSVVEIADGDFIVYRGGSDFEVVNRLEFEETFEVVGAREPS